MDFMDIIGALALVTAFIYYCSQGIAMFLAGSMVRYAPYPYVYNLAGCALWVVFGGQHHLDAMYRLNIIGALLYAFYILLFLWRVDAAVLLAGVMLRVFASELLYGWFCTTVSCLATAAPLWNLRAVHRTKSIDTMPPLVIPAIAFPNGLLWILRNTINIHPIDRRLVTASGVAAFSALVQIGVHTLFWVRPPPPPPPPEGDLLAPLIPDGEREALQRVEVKDGSDKDDKSKDGSDKDKKSNDGSDKDNKSNESDDDGEKKEKDDEENPDDLRLDVKSLEEKIALKLMLNQEKLVKVKDHSLPHGNPSLLDDLEEKGRSAVKVPTTSDVPELSSGVIEKSTDPAMSGESRQVSSAVVNKASESAAAPEQPESEGQVSA